MVNRGFCSSVGFKYKLDCSRFRRDVQDSLSSVPWWARGTDMSRASRTVDVLSGPAMRRPAPTRPWYVRVLDSAGSSSIKYVFYSCFRRFIQNDCPRCPESKKSRLHSGRTDPSAPHPAPKRFALPLLSAVCRTARTSCITFELNFITHC